MGKQASEWRGEGVAYRREKYNHMHVENKEGALALVLVGGEMGRGEGQPSPSASQHPAVGVVSVHLPHHANAARTDQLLSQWETSLAMGQDKVIMGGDLNETFLDFEQGVAAETGRGETVLQWLDDRHLRLPLQQMEKPTYHPYNKAMKSRRLDYIAVKHLRTGEGLVLEGTRDVVQSDHDAVAIHVHHTIPAKTKLEATWGPRILRNDDEVQAGLQQARRGDPHRVIAEVSKAITLPAPQGGEPWQESADLKCLRAQARRAPPEERRACWKKVWGTYKQERRAWMKRKVEAAARMNWGELRALGKQAQNKQWEHHLTSQEGWEQRLKKHFEGTFATRPKEQVNKAFDDLRHALRGLCKRTPWSPFDEGELLAAMTTWGRRKATGVDEVSLEALGALQQDDTWRGRLLYLFNDVLYTGKLYGDMGVGITILLPKVTVPEEWGQTRPITLSSATLKWFSQLLLGRCSHHFNPLTDAQWAWKGKQAEELIMVLRKVMRVGVEWQLPTWIAKLDVKKAFDSVFQESMGAMVAYWVGERGGRPWEAHAWMALLQADAVRVSAGGQIIVVEQTTGVRQGGPDSPVLFAALMGRNLQRAQLPQQDASGHGPLCPYHEGAFMDDTYVWDHDAARFQQRLSSVEKALEKDGLQIHPRKTVILTNAQQPGKFRIGGEWVTPQNDQGSFHILGSPVAFKHQVALLVAEMQTRARKAFHAHAKELMADAPLGPRLQLFLIYVRPAALWGCSAWPPHDTLLKGANACQLHYVRKIMRLGRKAGETWVDWNQRSLRGARVVQSQPSQAAQQPPQQWGHQPAQQGAADETHQGQPCPTQPMAQHHPQSNPPQPSLPLQPNNHRSSGVTHKAQATNHCTNREACHHRRRIHPVNSHQWPNPRHSKIRGDRSTQRQNPTKTPADPNPSPLSPHLTAMTNQLKSQTAVSLKRGAPPIPLPHQTARGKTGQHIGTCGKGKLLRRPWRAGPGTAMRERGSSVCAIVNARRGRRERGRGGGRKHRHGVEKGGTRGARPAAHTRRTPAAARTGRSCSTATSSPGKGTPWRHTKNNPRPTSAHQHSVRNDPTHRRKGTVTKVKTGRVTPANRRKPTGAAAPTKRRRRGRRKRQKWRRRKERGQTGSGEKSTPQTHHTRGAPAPHKLTRPRQPHNTHTREGPPGMTGGNGRRTARRYSPSERKPKSSSGRARWGNTSGHLRWRTNTARCRGGKE